MTNPKLYIIGDSFSVPPLPQDQSDPPIYTRLIRDRLSEQHGCEIEVRNASLMGASQDWIWTHLQAWLEYEMTPEDYLIVTLTHPSRMWFIDRLPGLTNINIIDLDEHATKEETTAIMMYIKHIQRPQLDLMNINNRFGYLCYQILKRGLRRPLVIKCFSQDLDQAVEWSEFMLAKGVIMDDVQQWEFEDPDSDRDAKYWYGLDCRYNHLCLSNHTILANKIITAFETDTAPDLTEGFIKGLLKPHSLQDEEFVKKELDVCTFEHNRRFRDQFAPKIPWAKRMGLKTFQLDK